MNDNKPHKLLDSIHIPTDLRRLPLHELPRLCEELRDCLIQELSENPGHFASSLGVVELTVALHYVFNTPEDRIVWDVGHQAYAHKILTGRRQNFYTNRKLGGLHPFPTPSESEYDTFTCGHASNSISAALGMSVADTLMHSQRKVVAVIGDGSMTGGLAFEGLNNASGTPNNMLIILNDNNMSIDHSVGGMKHYLHHLHTGTTYNNFRQRVSQTMVQWGWINEHSKKRIIVFNNAMKALLNNQQNIFEGMNIRYFGPNDGHDVIELVRTLRNIKDMKGPKLLHLHTRKGKGYEPAEKNATIWHAPGKFNPETGERYVENTENLPPRYQDVFGHTIVELAKENPRIVGITPAMPTGCSLNIMMHEMPDRTFDVGIAEGHAVTFAGGLATEGMQPFCNIYSAFAQRAYDNIIHDVAIERLPVVFCLDRAGLVGEDGATHHGAFDMAALRPIPNLTICSPMDEQEMRHMMYTAQLPDKGPFVIRYPRGRAEHTEWRCPMQELPIGKARCMKQGKDIALFSIGPLGNLAAQAIRKAEQMATEAGKTLCVAHYDMRFLKPIDEELLHQAGQHFSRIITLEDGAKNGGLGSAVIEFMAENGYKPHVIRLGLPDHFVEHGTINELQHIVGIDEEAIIETLTKACKESL